MICSAKKKMFIILFITGLLIWCQTAEARESSEDSKITFRIHGNGRIRLTAGDGTERVVESGETAMNVPYRSYVRLEAESEEESRISVSVTNKDGIELEPATSENTDSYIREITGAGFDKTVDITFAGVSAQRRARAAAPAVMAATAASQRFPEQGDRFTGQCTVKSVSGGNGHTVHGVVLGDFTGILAGEGNVQANCAQHSAAAPVAGMKFNYTYTITLVDKTAGKVKGVVYATSQIQPADGSVDSEGYLIGYQALSAMFELEREYNGRLRLRKSSADTQMTAGNDCYELVNARYGVYTNTACTERKAILTTLDNGYTDTVELPVGKYYIKEIKAPQGYALDGKVYTANVTAGNTDDIEIVSVSDRPQNAPVDLLILKKDAETGNSSPQGAASLAGAEFQIKYYAGYYDSDPASTGVKAARSWVLKTDSSGRISLRDPLKVSGDPFYKNSAGVNTLPLGTVTIRETKAPTGYLIDSSLYVRKITAEGSGETVTTYQSPTVSEKVIRGDLSLVKYEEDPSQDSDQKRPLQGIIFEITSVTTGRTVQIVTDKYGYASTEQLGDARGALAYDTYIVHEKNPPDGMSPVRDFKVTVSGEGQMLYYILENTTLTAPVRLVKLDSTTGNTIPAAGVKFHLLDAAKQKVAMTTYYPKKEVHDTFETDEDGSFILPEKLPAGKYYFREQKAPEGYMLSEEDIPFTISGNYDWDVPLTVTFSNEPARGRIGLFKSDADTGDPLPGAGFTITAVGDIVTPDGTVRAVDGEIVEELTTDDKGMAESGELFLGTYRISETVQPPGYVRTGKTWEVELTWKDQHMRIVEERLEIENTPTRIVIDKKETGSEKRLPGVVFEIWEKPDPEPPLSETEEISEEADEISEKPEQISGGESEIAERMEETETQTGEGTADKMIVVTGEDGTVTLERLLPGTYCIQEKEAVTGYAIDDTVHEFSVDEDGKVNGQEEGRITIENDATRIDKTKVHNVETKDQTAEPGILNAIDTVSMTDLQPGTLYRLRGVLMNADTGEPLRKNNSENGTVISAETVFVADASDMDVEVEFLLDATEFAGWTIAVFEYLYQDETEISSHEDLEEQMQQLTINNPEPPPTKERDPDEPGEPPKTDEPPGTGKPPETGRPPKTGDGPEAVLAAAAAVCAGGTASALAVRSAVRRGKRRK